MSNFQNRVNILTLNRLKVLNERQEEVLISTFWKDSPVIIVFIRHFGCISCRSHVEQVWEKRDEIFKKGAKIIFIGSGAPYLIKEFKKEFNLQDVSIFTDPTLATFEACGLKHINTKNLDEKSLKAIAHLEKKGYELKIIENDGSDTQLGGVVALKPPGLVTYHFISEYIGDFDNPDPNGKI